LFGQLPKLFDRNFVIGYFLPVVLFAAASYGVATGFGVSGSLGSESLSLLTKESVPANTATIALVPLVTTTIIALGLWLVAVLLLAMNRPLYQLMEGYGEYNPARLLVWKEKRRYNRLQARKRRATEYAEKHYLKYQEAEQFPAEDDLLPTRFGNTIRAWEIYPDVVYGIEAVEGWNRLAAVITKDYQTLVNEAKVQTDFWLNLWCLGFLVAVEYFCLAAYAGISDGISEYWHMLWFLPVILLFPLFTSWGARTAAIEWGNYVKSAFDTFLPELGKKLGFPPIITHEQELELWRSFKQVTMYRSDERRDHLLKQFLVDPTSVDIGPVDAVSILAEQLALSRSEAAELRSQLKQRTQENSTLRKQLKEGPAED
jgi:hypothetical protein